FYTSYSLITRFCFLLLPPPPRSTLFPYTTLFRSVQVSTAPAFTAASAGISIDQGPSLLIDAAGKRHLAYIEDWRVSAPYDHGRRSEEHTSELQSRSDLVCRLLLEKKKKNKQQQRL